MLHELTLSLADLIGMVGVSIILTAYYLLNTHRVKAENVKYQLFNLFGSILILYSLFFHWNMASVMIEIAWIIISLIGFQRALQKRKRNNYAI